MNETSPDQPIKTEQRSPDDHAEEVAPGILRIMLPIDMPGLGHVNCYVLEDDRGLALVDPGLADGVSHQVLANSLAEVGLDILRVHTVVVTHSHFDHFGGLARLQAIETVQPVEVIGFRGFGSGWHHAYGEILEEQDSSALLARTPAEIADVAARLVRPTPWGQPTDPFSSESLVEWSEGIDAIDVLRPPNVTREVDDGDVVALGGRDWVVIHTPGHADDHLCLWNEDEGVLLSGDHVLPTITPHISGLSHHADPLHVFFESLERIEALEGSTAVLPAHGDPFVDAAGRSRSIREHHVGRLERLRDIGTEIGQQPVDNYMKLLFRERSWGNMAASETYAHLEWLRIHDGATRYEAGGILRYEV